MNEVSNYPRSVTFSQCDSCKRGFLVRETYLIGKRVLCGPCALSPPTEGKVASKEGKVASKK